MCCRRSPRPDRGDGREFIRSSPWYSARRDKEALHPFDFPVGPSTDAMRIRHVRSSHFCLVTSQKKATANFSVFGIARDAKATAACIACDVLKRRVCRYTHRLAANAYDGFKFNNKDGGLNVIGGDGFEVLKNANAKKTIPESRNAKAGNAK